MTCNLNLSFLSFPIRDFDSLNEEDHAANLQLALDISEREFGIRSFTSVKELSDDQELDKTRMTIYLSKFYELFRGTPLPASGTLLYSNVLYCTVMYCNVLYSTLLSFTILYSTVLYCAKLYLTVSNCSLHDSTLFYLTLLYPALLSSSRYNSSLSSWTLLGSTQLVSVSLVIDTDAHC